MYTRVLESMSQESCSQLLHGIHRKIATEMIDTCNRARFDGVLQSMPKWTVLSRHRTQVMLLVATSWQAWQI